MIQNSVLTFNGAGFVYTSNFSHNFLGWIVENVHQSFDWKRNCIVWKGSCVKTCHTNIVFSNSLVSTQLNHISQSFEKSMFIPISSC